MKFDLHEHQTLAIDLLRRSLGAGRRRPMLQAPTGAGKTIISASIVEGALVKGNQVIFVVPALSLVDQTVLRFAEQGIHAVGVMQGYHPATDASQPVQVATVQTLKNRKLPAAGIVIIDEAHKWFEFYGKWMAEEAWQKVPFIGLSATPWTKGLGKHFDDLLIPTTTKKLITTVNPDTGRTYLSPFKVFAPSHPDLTGVKTVAGDYHEGQLSDAMSGPTLIADVVSTWLKLGEDRPTLCFAVDRAHARKLAEQFESAGVPTGYVDMDTPVAERNLIGERLKHGQIKVVVNIATLTTGIDWDVRCVILARPTKSEMLFVQIIGRGLRSVDGKKDCLVLDHSDTTLRLGFVDDIHHEKLNDGRHAESKERANVERLELPKECTSCSLLKPAGVHVCPSCGFAPTRQSAIEEQQGELIALKGARKGKREPSPHSPQEVFSMLLWIQRDRDYSQNYAKAKYMDRYGEWPNGLHRNPMVPDAAFINWHKSQQIRFAKRKQKESRNAA